MEIKHFDSTPTDPGIKSSMALEATVENKPQQLKKIKSFEAFILGIPANMKAEAQIVLQALFSCFEKQGTVAEGILEDVYWGFEQNTPPIPRNLVWNGLRELRALGYVRFQAPDNVLAFEPIPAAWLRYQPKLLDMVYSL